jgi:hypothetical protein
MKHTQISQTDSLSAAANPLQKRASRFQSGPGRSGIVIKSVLTLCCLALLITVYVLAHRSVSNRSTTVDPLPSSSDSELEVEVLDGAGNMKAALYITKILRSKGYDVVELKKNNDGLIERSYVLDRSGDLDVARKLAVSLGISQDKVFQKIDHNLYLDLSVVLGKDYTQLKVFQVWSERSKP